VRKLLLVIACAFSAHASPFTILSGIASSGFGVAGVGGFQRDAVVLYSLEQYHRDDISLPNLQQDVYFRYSYVFAASSGSATTHPFDRLILGLYAGCETDSECIFGIETEGTSAETREIRLYANDDRGPNPGLIDPVYGILLDAFSPSLHILPVSFFSNRIPDPEGRIYLQGGDDYLLTDPGAVITPGQLMTPQTENPESIPEPLTSGLLAGGLAGIVLLRKAARL
jgi:hypothetical protein